MKRVYITCLKSLVAGMLLLASGCNDWLDVNPRTEIKEDDIYTSEAGFKNVMNGIYIQLASRDLYGRNTSFYFPDLLAQLWSVNSNSMEDKIKKFDYKDIDVEARIDDIWSNYYTCIAHVNNIIENLRNTDVAFSAGNKDLLMGEAYGLRAFIHLDLLRLFGPVPLEATDETMAIPYVTELTKDPNSLSSTTYGEVKRMILQDLDSAEVYLQKDPFREASMNDLNNPGSTLVEYVPEDEWYYYRQTHFNCYAVDAVRARFYQWIGDTDKAVTYAKKVLAAKNPDDSEKFTLMNEAVYSDTRISNLVFQCEHIFAVNSSNHQDIIQNMFSASNSPKLYSTKTNVNSRIYENEKNDIRNKEGRYWSIDGSNAYFLKYLGSGVIKANNMVPLVRLSEMYLILIENAPIAEATEYFVTYRNSRGMNQSMTITESGRKERVKKEFAKEFIGEGQLFYWYKRHNEKQFTIPTKSTVPAGGYVVPKPNSQVAFE